MDERNPIPYAVKDEEELNEDAPKGENPSHKGGGDGVREPRLVWDLTRNLVCAHRLLHGLKESIITRIFKRQTYWLSEAEEGPKEGEREGDAEPEAEEGQESGKWNGCRGLGSPEKQVQEEEDSEHNSGHKQSRHQHIALPAEATHH